MCSKCNNDSCIHSIKVTVSFLLNTKINNQLLEKNILNTKINDQLLKKNILKNRRSTRIKYPPKRFHEEYNY